MTAVAAAVAFVTVVVVAFAVVVVAVDFERAALLTTMAVEVELNRHLTEVLCAFELLLTADFSTDLTLMMTMAFFVGWSTDTLDNGNWDRYKWATGDMRDRYRARVNEEHVQQMTIFSSGDHYAKQTYLLW